MISFLPRKSINPSAVILAAMLFLMPLVFNPLGFDMYGIPKNLILKVGISLLVILVALSIARRKSLEVMLNRNTLKWTLVFLLILALAEATALRQNVSFFGSYFRQGGILNMLNYTALFLVALSLFANKKSREFILKAVIVSGVISAIYAIAQRLGFDLFTPEHTAIFEKRSFAGMGNPTALGAYLLFPIGAQIIALYESKTAAGGAFKSALPRVNGFAGLLLMVVALFLTRNRASILGLLAAGLLFLFKKIWENRKWRVYGIAGALIALLAFVYVYGGNTRSLGSRLTTWQSSVEIIKEKPIFGYGPESFDVLFERFVRPDFFKFEDYKNLVDRPHNEFLQMWIDFGLGGVLFYLGLWAALLLLFWKKPRPSLRVSILSLTMIALLVSNWFSFSLPVHYVLFTVFLALIVAETGCKKKIVPKNALVARGMATALIVLAGFNGFWAVRMAMGDYDLARAFFSVAQNNVEIADQSAQRALKLNVVYADTSKNAYDLYYSLATTFADVKWLEKAAEDNVIFQKVTHNSLYSLLNEARMWALIKDYKKAEEVYQRIAETKGINPVFYEEWANMYVDAEQYDKAAMVYDELFAILPPDWQAPLLSKGAELTREQRIFWKNHGSFLETLDKALKAYVATGQVEKAAKIVDAVK